MHVIWSPAIYIKIVFIYTLLYNKNYDDKIKRNVLNTVNSQYIHFRNNENDKLKVFFNIIYNKFANYYC